MGRIRLSDILLGEFTFWSVWMPVFTGAACAELLWILGFHYPSGLLWLIWLPVGLTVPVIATLAHWVTRDLEQSNGFMVVWSLIAYFSVGVTAQTLV
jgi:hypothetical protein